MFFSEGDMISKYGENTWAIITGASAGIGREFCLKLAEKGFNIVLMARDLGRMKNVEDEIRMKYPQVETKLIVSDFKNAVKDGFFEGIMEQLVGLDISILVNNVGMHFKGFEEASVQEIKNLIIVNCIPHAVLTRNLLSQLQKREKRSAIIDISSIGATFPRSHSPIYSATKVFNDFLSRGIQDLYSNIDVISIRPRFVMTQMTNFKKPDINTVLPEDVVVNSLASLGKMDATAGALKHRFTEWRYLTLPSFITGFK